ncbi:MAG TPA: hypothetical protein PKO09_13795 [Anaerolineae bacterium]|nr:hypothetical protein [Anaerolineae bacterium]
MLSPVLEHVRHSFALPLGGIHGEAHWHRVHDNGLRLAERTGADTRIVALFAYLHDSCRLEDGWDRDHGRRAAKLVRSLNGRLLDLPGEDLECLAYACTYHADGLVEAGVTVQTCWDADRLDLGRIGVRPNPARLCTPAARDPEMIAWAWARSRSTPQERT